MPQAGESQTEVQMGMAGKGGAGRAKEANHEGRAETRGQEGRGGMARTSALGWEQLGMPAGPAC